jgi:peptide subunit release factor 1 (eRF1)
MTAIDVISGTTPAEPHLPTRERVDRLGAVQASRRLIVSCYVRLGLEDRTRRRYQIAVRDAIRLARGALERSDAPHDDREAVVRDFERIEAYLGDAGQLPHSPGVAVFACESLDLFEMIPLPRVLGTRIMVDTRPRIAEVLAAVNEFGRIVVAAIDRTHARFFEVTAFEVTELPSLASMTTRGGKFHSDREDSPGWGERSFHNRIREERHRYLAGVGHELMRLAMRGPLAGILLAGPGKSTSELARFLPRHLEGRVLGMPHLNPTSVTAAEIRRATFEALAAHEVIEERALVADLESQVGARWAVDGARPTLRALSRGQLRTLVIRAGLTGAGFRCAASGRLVLAKADCGQEGSPEPVPELVNEVIEEALHQGVSVRQIHDPEAAEGVDGLGGFLRFR